MKLLLVDDHAMVRAGLRAMMASWPEANMIMEAADGQEALQLATHQPLDIILMDIAMPGLNGLEAIRQIHQLKPQIGLVVLSMYADEEYVVRAFQAGALAYLLKESSPTILRSALQAVSRGQRYLGPPLTEQLVEEYLHRLGQSETRLERLTPREREVLQLIAEGNSTQAIAHRLHLSPKTVETHRANLMDKLNVYEVASLTRFALRSGLVRE